MEGQHDMFGELLSTARANLFQKARTKSQHCPCCDKHVKVYKRKFNSSMARTLIHTYPFFKQNPKEWLDVAHHLLKVVPGRVPSDYGKVVWWGLMEVCPSDKFENSIGLYRMTPSGMLFTQGKIKVPSHAIEYRSNVESFAETEIDIIGALGKNFDYYELMREPGVW